MCGIAGFCDFSKKMSHGDLVHMTDCLHHRGPDDQGYKYVKNNFAVIGLGHKRLSIQDLSSHGHQPMVFEHLTIVFNGEIYNFIEIRKELEEYGYSFESHSDTEVVLKAYHKWGMKAVDKFNGMFAFAIFDEKAETITLLRDRVGVKPLFWYMHNDTFLFSSELKSFYVVTSFNKDLDRNSIGMFFQYSYVPQPYTIFKNTYKLKSGHYLTIDLSDKSVTEKEYWNISDFYQKESMDISYDAAKDRVEELLYDSIQHRLIADVDVGVFLSGGYDSSCVAAIARDVSKSKINTFTIGFKEAKYNEAPYAKEISNILGTNHHELYATKDEFNDVLTSLVEFYDEPFGDSSSIPTTLVSRLASEHVKVSLSADGGDELFAGYSRYMDSLRKYKQITKLPNIVKQTLSVVSRNVPLDNIEHLIKINNFHSIYNKLKSIDSIQNVSDMYRFSMTYFTKYELDKLLTFKVDGEDTFFTISEPMNSNLKTIMNMDIKTYLTDEIMVKVDRATMSASLEGREPLLDYKLMEFVAQLPDHYKYHDGVTKRILKDLVHKRIPKKIMDRPKMGFVSPIAMWLDNDLKYLIDDNLNKEAIVESGVLNYLEVQRIVSLFLSGRKEYTQKIWFLIVFQLWFKRWMKNS